MNSIGQIIEDAVKSNERHIKPSEHLPGTSKAYALGVLLAICDRIQFKSLGRFPERNISRAHGKPSSRAKFALTKILRAVKPHLENHKKVHPQGEETIMYQEVLHFIQSGTGCPERINELAKLDYMTGNSAMNRYYRLYFKDFNAGAGDDGNIPVEIPDEESGEESGPLAA
jgi:hypothetical protein